MVLVETADMFSEELHLLQVLIKKVYIYLFLQKDLCLNFSKRVHQIGHLTDAEEKESVL